MQAEPIRRLEWRYDVSEAVRQIEANPSVWNRHRDRLDRYGSPHAGVSDIWVRFNPLRNMATDPVAFFQGEHESEWYPVADEIPAVRALAIRLFKDVGGARLGGVLVTKIPAGGEVKPHVDTGWHAGFYDKFAIQLKGNAEQAFCFDDARLSAMPGESYWFRNDVTHWVENPSPEDRMTLICCIKRGDTHAQ